jgi:hypothetical protein
MRAVRGLLGGRCADAMGFCRDENPGFGHPDSWLDQAGAQGGFRLADARKADLLYHSTYVVLPTDVHC